MSWYVFVASDPNRHDYFKSIVKHLMDLYSKGKIRPVIDSTWAFEDVRALFFTGFNVD